GKVTAQQCSLAKRIYFVIASDDARDLRSFPTRRSSDLRRLRARIVEPGARPRSACGWPPSACRCARGRTRRRRRCVRRQGRRRADRKSTRLNSSHVAISYAVFCLKKKTVTALERQQRAR